MAFLRLLPLFAVVALVCIPVRTMADTDPVAETREWWMKRMDVFYGRQGSERRALVDPSAPNATAPNATAPPPPSPPPLNATASPPPSPPPTFPPPASSSPPPSPPPSSPPPIATAPPVAPLGPVTVDNDGRLIQPPINPARVSGRSWSLISIPAGPVDCSIVVDCASPIGPNADFTTIGAAITWIGGQKSTNRWIICLAPCEYTVQNTTATTPDRCQLYLGNNLPPITMVGQSPDTTKISCGVNASTIINVAHNGQTGVAAGTTGSATVTVASKNYVAENIYFINTTPEQPRGGLILQTAVAWLGSGDFQATYNCRFDGYQDTFYDKAGRHYHWCDWISGTVDYVFGNAQSIIERSILYNIPTGLGYDYTTAQKRDDPTNKTGTVIRNCAITGNGVNRIYGGRPWGFYAYVVYIRNYLDAGMAGFWPWQSSNATADAIKNSNYFYGDYQNTGPGNGYDRTGSTVSPNLRLAATTLSDADAQRFLDMSFIDPQPGWNPVIPPLSACRQWSLPSTMPLAPPLSNPAGPPPPPISTPPPTTAKSPPPVKTPSPPKVPKSPPPVNSPPPGVPPAPSPPPGVPPSPSPPPGAPKLRPPPKFIDCTNKKNKKKKQCKPPPKPKAPKTPSPPKSSSSTGTGTTGGDGGTVIILKPVH